RCLVDEWQRRCSKLVINRSDRMGGLDCRRHGGPERRRDRRCRIAKFRRADRRAGDGRQRETNRRDFDLWLLPRRLARRGDRRLEQGWNQRSHPPEWGWADRRVVVGSLRGTDLLDFDRRRIREMARRRNDRSGWRWEQRFGPPESSGADPRVADGRQR